MIASNKQERIREEWIINGKGDPRIFVVFELASSLVHARVEKALKAEGLDAYIAPKVSKGKEGDCVYLLPSKQVFVLKKDDRTAERVRQLLEQWDAQGLPEEMPSKRIEWPDTSARRISH
jgi:hypothetical protein